MLAGGRGRRLGGAGKATVDLAGRPLAAYPAEALAAVCPRVALVAKADSPLPSLAGVEHWIEPAEPRHPLAGLVHALERAGGWVLVCAADMPFVTPAALRRLCAAAGSGEPPATAVVALADGRLEPLLGLYGPAALEPLREAEPDVPLTRSVEALAPVLVPVAAELTAGVNTPAELASARARLAARAPGGG